MSIQITVPELGESVIEATVLRWLKHEGEPVAAGETVVELETEKVNLDVGAPGAGVLVRIAHKEGTDVKIGDVLGEIEATGQGTGDPSQALGTGSGRTTNDGEGQAGEGNTQSVPASGEIGGNEIKATPVAQRLAREAGIDLNQVAPSSPDQRITKQDVESYLEKLNNERAVISNPLPVTGEKSPGGVSEKPSAAISDQSPVTGEQLPSAGREARVAYGEARRAGGEAESANREERVRMSRRRQTIARRLVEAQQTAAMLTTFNEVDMSAVMELRKRYKESFKQRHGVGLGLTSLFVPAVVSALKAFPRLNAEIQGDEIVYRHHYDIGIAVGAEDGLVVPVLRDAERLSLPEIEKRIHAFGEKAQSGTLSLNDLRGGTFTISNGGVYGSLLSTPILNPPQVGILGLHKIEERPIAREGQVVIRPMMYVALSYDHRLVDGREAVQFLVRVKELIEDPAALLLEG